MIEAIEHGVTYRISNDNSFLGTPCTDQNRKLLHHPHELLAGKAFLLDSVALGTEILRVRICAAQYLATENYITAGCFCQTSFQLIWGFFFPRKSKDRFILSLCEISVCVVLQTVLQLQGVH